MKTKLTPGEEGIIAARKGWAIPTVNRFRDFVEDAIVDGMGEDLSPDEFLKSCLETFLDMEAEMAKDELESKSKRWSTKLNCWLYKMKRDDGKEIWVTIPEDEQE